MKKNLIYSTIISLLFASCQSVIEPDFKDVEPQLIIEGEITNLNTPTIVKLSKSTNFTASSQFVGVGNALVIITDDTGVVDTLTMTELGIYKTDKITGTPLHQYNLRVICEGKEYTATSIMPQQVLIDTVYQSELTMMGRRLKFIKAVFTDSFENENQYRFKLYQNNIPNNNTSVISDKYFNGLQYESNLNLSDGTKPGDTIRVDFMCIDKNVYNYFKSLEQTLNSQNGVPANPISNITGGCLGYFSAYTLTEKIIVIE